MAYGNSTSVLSAPQAPPIVAQLQAVFDRLDDDALINKLIGPTRRGPKGYPVRVLWRCFIAKYVLGLASTEALRRELRNNPFIAEVCGITTPDAIPHHSTFSRFFKKLASNKRLHLVKDVSRSLVRNHYMSIPGFGKRVAIDSTTLKARANGGKAKKADQQAGWSVKKGTQGHDEFVYGWKLHLMVDCETEWPIAAIVSPGNVHDAARASYVLGEARRATQGKFHPAFVMMDAGYSGKPLTRLIKRQYRGIAVVQKNRHHKKLNREMAEFRASAEFRALIKQRPAVERCFARLKGQRSLNNITVRRRMKVTVHCYLSLIAMQALAVRW